MIHIYTAGAQPATRYRFDVPGIDIKPFWIRNKPLRQLWTNCCRKRRWAKHCVVKVYYDCTHVFCCKGHGCKKATQ